MATMMTKPQTVTVNGVKARLVSIERELPPLERVATMWGVGFVRRPWSPPTMVVESDKPMPRGEKLNVDYGGQQFNDCLLLAESSCARGYGEPSTHTLTIRLTLSEQQKREQAKAAKKAARDYAAKVRKQIAAERPFVRKMVKLGHTPKLDSLGRLDTSGVVIGYDDEGDAEYGIGCSVCGKPLTAKSGPCPGVDEAKEARRRRYEELRAEFGPDDA